MRRSARETTETYRRKRCAVPLPETVPPGQPDTKTVRVASYLPLPMLPILRFFVDVRRPLLPVTCPLAAAAVPVSVSVSATEPPNRAVAPRLEPDKAIVWAEAGWRQPGVVVLVAPVAGMV